MSNRQVAAYLPAQLVGGAAGAVRYPDVAETADEVLVQDPHDHDHETPLAPAWTRTAEETR